MRTPFELHYNTSGGNKILSELKAEFKLVIDSEKDVSQRYLNKLTKDLTKELKKAGIRVKPVLEPETENGKGALQKIGELLLKVIPGAKTLLEVVKVINGFTKRKKCKIKVQVERKPDGTILKSWEFTGNLSSGDQQKRVKEMVSYANKVKITA